MKRCPTSGVMLPETVSEWRELLDSCGLESVPVPRNAKPDPEPTETECSPKKQNP